MKGKLLLIRHGTTTAEKNVLLGSNDLPLSESGRNECRELKAGISVDYSKVSFITSGLLRARQTSEIIFPGAGSIVDERLNEVDFGDWGGLEISEISKTYPDLMDSWASSPMTFKFPGGESVQDFIFRIQSFLSDRVVNQEGNIALICHGGVIRFIICAMLGIEFKNHLSFEIKRPSLNVIDYEGRYGVLSGLNISWIKI